MTPVAAVMDNCMYDASRSLCASAAAERLSVGLPRVRQAFFLLVAFAATFEPKPVKAIF